MLARSRCKASQRIRVPFSRARACAPRAAQSNKQSCCLSSQKEEQISDTSGGGRKATPISFFPNLNFCLNFITALLVRATKLQQSFWFWFVPQHAVFPPPGSHYTVLQLTRGNNHRLLAKFLGPITFSEGVKHQTKTTTSFSQLVTSTMLELHPM